jgi:hypothetical protein
VLSWKKKTRNRTLAALFIILFFLSALGPRPLLLSIVSTPGALKIIIQPPGYPVPGMVWNVQVWETPMVGHSNWVQSSNSTLVLETSGGNYTYNTDSQGSATIRYDSSLGKIVLIAEKLGFEPVSWVPQDSFVSVDVAWAFIGIFAAGGSTGVAEIFRATTKSRRWSPVLNVATYALLALWLFGSILSWIWLGSWRFGSEWGFGNRIINAFYFYPHLFTLGILTLFLASAIIIVSTRLSSSEGEKSKTDRKAKEEGEKLNKERPDPAKQKNAEERIKVTVGPPSRGVKRLVAERIEFYKMWKGVLAVDLMAWILAIAGFLYVFTGLKNDPLSATTL